MSTKIRWGWIVAGAVLLELALIVLFVPLLMSMDPARIVPFAPIGTLVLGFLISWWILRKVPGRRVLHGTLIGVLATLIYLAMLVIQPDGIAPVIALYGPFLFVVGNGLRIIGCIAGGFLSEREGVAPH